MNNCGCCQNWLLSGPLGKLGYGLCRVQTNPMLAAALRTSWHNQCRIGCFSPVRAPQAPSSPLPEPFEQEERLDKLSYGGSD